MSIVKKLASTITIKKLRIIFPESQGQKRVNAFVMRISISFAHLLDSLLANEYSIVLTSRLDWIATCIHKQTGLPGLDLDVRLPILKSASAQLKQRELQRKLESWLEMYYLTNGRGQMRVFIGNHRSWRMVKLLEVSAVFLGPFGQQLVGFLGLNWALSLLWALSRALICKIWAGPINLSFVN